jgi:hypothetical protein
MATDTSQAARFHCSGAAEQQRAVGAAEAEVVLHAATSIFMSRAVLAQ